MSIFDHISDRPYMVIAHDTPTLVMFEGDEPTATITNRYGVQQYDFNVNSNRILGISSKPLLRALKPYAPLGGKTTVIIKSGHGFETTYTVEEVHVKNRQKKLLVCFWDMGCTALALWGFLRKLLDWS